MAEKSFGVKDINLVGAAGTPTLESNGELYINASHVAIQTNTTISGVCTATNKLEIRVDDGSPARIDYYCEVSDSHYTRLQSAAHADYSGNVEVTLPVTSGDIIVGNASTSIDDNINTTGIITATSFTGDGANITGISTSNITDYGVGLGGGGSIAGINTTGTSYFSTIDLSSRILSDTFYVRDAGDTLNKMFFGASGTGHVVRLYAGGNERLSTTTNGIYVQGSVGSNGGANITGIVTATTFNGSGASLTNLPAGNLTGSLPAIDGSALTNISVTESDTLATVTARGDSTTAEITAANFRSNDTTGDGSDIGFAIKYYITANGSSSYRFAGPGVLNSTDDPTFYFYKGFTYILENSTGGSHPFRIQFTGTTIGVGTYVSGSQSGTQVFTIPHDAPTSYEYQCTFHSGMKGTFNVV